ncbi:MAG: Threonine-tRNA ligase [Berkelbacteria bacterium GW2011_GWA1_36_9]|uniref:Threonine--tRNA ligase n=1 Tax=Berkelbacteria bacterium GW2011_GWA1_36_9 TaxID=1618331 RepID=A0A0G0FJ61_9BACT|nr:MAG: Threonine-tRNA ligase [Berkelbacteria bacterium GW2011_GWA1_36_9]
MKILTLHCDYIRYQALKKAVKDAEELQDQNVHEIKEPLVVLTSIEQGDNEETIKQLVAAVEKTASEVKAQNIVLYPYAHLSSNLAKASEALSLLKEAEVQLKKKFKNVDRAPFGYYKSFEFKCKGHPLAELSKEFKATEGNSILKKGQSKGEQEINHEEIAQLVKKLSKVNMQAGRGKNDLKSNVELGRDLDLYIVNEVVGQGLPLLTPRGATIKREIERFAVDEELKRGYLHTSTPVMAKSDLYKVSGHWQHYQDSMFCIQSGDDTLALRPMTCPFHFILYKSKPRSYKDLPLKYAEIASLFRNEQSGELRGLTRVRQFTLADAHIICRKDQIEKQFEEVLDLLKCSMKKLGIKDIWYRFSKWDPKDKKKYIDNPKAWEESQSLMKKILDKLKVKYVEKEGEAAFYGPKLDLQYTDVYGKEDTLLTIQIDFALPERYDMTYTDENGKEVRPMVIHRSSTGATERVMAYILEKTQGALPLWMSPTQVRVISFTDRNDKATEKFAEELKEAIPKLRVDTDIRTDTVQSKIRDAEMLKINYILVIGDKEEENKTVAARPRGGKPKFGIKKDDFIKDIKKELDF